jgi:NAD(P)-dependent dehydrogenase (short-subunit alcohol dehydrogenase family)
MIFMVEPSNYQPGPDLLKERVILVTGASRGIGQVAALTFTRHGATVILHGRDVERLEAVYDEIEAAGGPQPIILPLDLAKAAERDYDNLAQAIESQLGRLDGILHNASHSTQLGPLQNERLTQWLDLLRVNLAAPFALTQACAHLLRASPDASVILTAETHALRPAAYWGGFAVSKAGLLALSTIQAQEWEPLPNLRINVIVPGKVSSPLRARTHPGETADSRAAPESLMPLYLYLMGPDSRGTSGQVFEAGEPPKAG